MFFTVEKWLFYPGVNTIETAESQSVILPSGDSLWSTSGYTFSGWAETATGIDKYKAGDKYSSSKSITLYAVWTPNPKITYDSNNGTGETITEYYKSGDKVTIKETSFTKDGCTLSRWSTSQNATDTYTIGQEITLTKDLTLYAVWVKDEEKVTITFNPETKTEKPHSISATKGEEIALPSGDSLWKVSECTFSGWAEEVGGDVAYKAGEKFSSSKDSVELYAVWKANLTIKYHSNYGEGKTEETLSEGYRKGDKVTIKSTNFKKNGYTLSGWSTPQKDGEDAKVEYIVGQEITLEDDLELYAVWVEDKYAVTIELDSGKLGKEKRTINTIKGNSVILPSGENLWSTKEYTFSGWSETASGKVVKEAGEAYTVTAEEKITLYAIWSTNPKITYHSNYGTGDIISEYYKSGDTVTIKSTSFTREGYTLSGWSQSSSDDAGSAKVEYIIGQEIPLTNNLELYAVWDKNITMTLYSGLSEINKQEIKAIKGNSVVLPSGEELWTTEDCVFKYWTTLGHEKCYNAGAKYTADGDITLYAVWTSNKTTLTYNANGGEGSVDSDSGEPGRVVTLDNGESLSKAGFNFAGWTDGTTTYTGSSTLKLDKDITLYAVWKEKTNIKYYDKSRLVAIAYLQGDSTTIGNGGGAIQSKGLYWTIDLNGGGTPYKVGDEYNGGSTTLYAQYEEGKSYNITYKNSNDTEITVEGNPESYTRYEIAKNENENVVISYAPTKSGYVFKGWRLETEENDQATEEYTITAETAKNITLVAVWKDIATKYSIFYSIGNDVVEASGNPTSYTRYTTDTSNKDVTISGVPKRTGYYFKGWKKKGTEDSTATREYTIKADEKGDIILVAVWEQPIKVGDIIENGTYPSSLKDSADEKEKAYADKPIEWRCIQYDEENNYALMISDKVITTNAFRSDVNSNTYSDSTIRTYLTDTGDGNFIKAYKIDTSRMIGVTYNGTEETVLGTVEDSNDKLFLLSMTEVKYIWPEADGADRVAYDLSGSASDWWLRSSHINARLAYCVNTSGEINIDHWVQDKYGVRPAFWLDLSKF